MYRYSNARTIPWLENEKRYAALFTNRKGNVAKPLMKTEYGKYLTAIAEEKF